MRASQLVGLIGMGAFLASCQKTASDGLSVSGHIHPVRAGNISELTRDDLSDASYILAQLHEIIADAPPIYQNNTASLTKWRDFYSAKKALLFSDSDGIVMPISCLNGTSDIKYPISYDIISKNISINLYTGDTDQATVSEQIEHLLDEHAKYSTNKVRAASLGVAAFALNYDDDLTAAEKPLLDKVDEITLTAGSLTLPNGSIIDINSPLVAVGPRLGLDLAKSDGARENAILNIIRGKPYTLVDMYGPLNNEASSWEFYPEHFLAQPFWRTSIPYAGDPKNVCLLGEFDQLDLPNRPDAWVIGNHNAKLSGDLLRWFLVDRNNLHVIAEETAPRDKIGTR